jgi:hypothetical protein
VLLDRRIRVFILDEVYSVWDADEIYTLRVKYRVVGGLVGCLPGVSQQNAIASTPLMLSFEELVLLHTLGMFVSDCRCAVIWHLSDCIDVYDNATILAVPADANARFYDELCVVCGCVCMLST